MKERIALRTVSARTEIGSMQDFAGRAPGCQGLGVGAIERAARLQGIVGAKWYT